MHNSPEKNLRFANTWAENNIRYLLGEEQTDKVKELIAFHRASIVENTAKLMKIPNPFWPTHNCLGTPLA